MFTEASYQVFLNLYSLFETSVKWCQISLDLRIHQTDCKLTHFIPSNGKMTEHGETLFHLTQGTRK